jgi:GT2 family glycosyltransferase
VNNDCVLLAQQKNLWVEQLLGLFEKDPKCAVSGVTKIWCPHARREFVIFFCAIIPRQLFEKHGYLDEQFSPGGGEDTEFCIRMQDLGYNIHQFGEQTEIWNYGTPIGIYHAAEGTFKELPNHNELHNRNSALLEQRFRKPITRSVIVAIDKDTPVESLMQCTRSIWRYTEQSQTEIIFACPSEHDLARKYIFSVLPFGNYQYVEHTGSYGTAIAAGVTKAVGKYVAVINDRAELLHQSQNEWLDRLQSVCNEVSSPVVIEGKPSLFCFMAHRGLLVGYDSVSVDDLIPYKVRATDSLSINKGMASGTFPIYYCGNL